MRQDETISTQLRNMGVGEPINSQFPRIKFSFSYQIEEINETITLHPSEQNRNESRRLRSQT